METFVGGMLAVPSRRCQIGDLLFPLLAKWNPNRWMAKGREKKTKGEGRVKEKTKNFLLQSLRQFRISSKKSAFRPVSLWWVNEIVVIQSSFQAEFNDWWDWSCVLVTKHRLCCGGGHGWVNKGNSQEQTLLLITLPLRLLKAVLPPGDKVNG